MKKNLLFLFLLIGTQTQAQQILNIYSVPANPTTADSVYILVDCQFTSGGCAPYIQNHYFITSTDIGASALHCLGPLAFICNYTDTFSLGMLAAGNYTFTFQLDEGHGGPPCTPGIVPGPNDSYNFTVSVPTSVEEIQENTFVIYPNPSATQIEIQNPKSEIQNIEIYDAVGEKLFSQQPATGSQERFVINVSDYPVGIYFVQITSGDRTFGKMFSVQR